MVEFNEDVLRGAVLLANEVNGYHDEKSAKTLHGSDWQFWRRPLLAYRYIDLETLTTDSTRCQLLVDAATTAVQALPGQRQRECISLYFGLEDGIHRTLQEVGEGFGVTHERVRQVIAKGIRQLRYPYRDVFKYFIPEYPTEEIPQLLASSKEKQAFHARS